MASYVAAYRIAALVCGAGTLFLVSGFETLGLGKQTAWSAGYVAMALLVLVGVATTLLAVEPAQSAAATADHAVHARDNRFKRVAEAAIGAFLDFFARDMALVVLAFLALFKLADALASALTTPFVLDLGFSRNACATIIKALGFIATLTGGFAGGYV